MLMTARVTHTPLPWTAQIGLNRRWEIVGPPNAEGKRCFIAKAGYDCSAEDAANARLFLAAPAMLTYITQRAESGDPEAQRLIAAIGG